MFSATTTDPTSATWGAEQTLELDLAGLTVGMIHDSGPAAGRLDRLRRQFPTADLVIFGHSHIPMDQAADGFRIFNPGSPTDKRRQPHRTLGLLTIDAGALTAGADRRAALTATSYADPMPDHLDLRPTPYDHPDVVALTALAQEFYVDIYGGPDRTPFTAEEFCRAARRLPGRLRRRARGHHGRLAHLPVRRGRRRAARRRDQADVHPP